MDPTINTNNSEPEWPLGWSIERYNRTSHNELKSSVSQPVSVRLHRTAMDIYLLNARMLRSLARLNAPISC